MDQSKEGVRAFGDLFMWKEMLQHAKATSRPMILVTEDRKEDWWAQVSGRKIGPRPELIQEFRESAGGVYYQYELGQFLEQSRTHHKKRVQRSVIEEVRAAERSVADVDTADHAQRTIEQQGQLERRLRGASGGDLMQRAMEQQEKIDRMMRAAYGGEVMHRAIEQGARVTRGPSGKAAPSSTGTSVQTQGSDSADVSKPDSGAGAERPKQDEATTELPPSKGGDSGLPRP